MFFNKSLELFQNSYIFFNAHSHLESKKNEITIFNQVNFTNLVKKYYSLSIHPWYLKDNYLTKIQAAKEYLDDPYLLAIGEVGLDKLSKVSFNLQIKAFQAILNNLWLKHPLIIHSVKAHKETLALIKAEKKALAVLIHGFYGNYFEALAYLKQNIYLGFGKSLFSNSQKTILVFKNYPLDLILLETDEQNTYSLFEIYQRGAFLRQMPFRLFLDRIKRNFYRFYGKMLL